MLLTYCHQFVRHLVQRDQAGFGIAVVPEVQVYHTPQVARLTQVPLVLFRKDMSEIGAFQFRFPADAVNAQRHLAIRVAHEGKAGIHADGRQPGQVQ